MHARACAHRHTLNPNPGTQKIEHNLKQQIEQPKHAQTYKVKKT